jgi:hypothetical protein
MNQTIFQLNIPAELTTNGSTKLYVFVATTKTDRGHIMVEFLNLQTTLVCDVSDWKQVFSLAMERCKAHWNRGQGQKKQDENLFHTLGAVLNPSLIRQNLS